MSGLSSEMQIKEELLVRVIHLPLLKQPTLIPFGYAKWPREAIEGSQSGFQTILDICDYTTTNRIKWGRASECELWKGVSSILSQESELLIKKKVIGCPVWKTRNTNINVTNEMAEPVSLKKNQKGSVGLLPYQLNPKLRKYTQKKGRSTIYDDDKEMINDLWEFGETMICMHDLIGHIISIQISFNLCLLLETKIKNVSLALEIYGPLCNLSDKKSSKNF